MSELSKAADGLSDDERKAPIKKDQREVAPDPSLTPKEEALPEGTAIPSSQPEAIAPDTQHLTPSPVPHTNTLGYLPHDAALYGTRPGVPEPDYSRTAEQQSESVKVADENAKAAAELAANHYSQEGDNHDPSRPELTDALAKVQGTVPIVQNIPSFVGDATPEHELTPELAPKKDRPENKGSMPAGGDTDKKTKGGKKKSE